MGILPKIKLNKLPSLEELEERESKQGKTFLIDFQAGKMLRKDGKLIKTDDERSVRMWIEKVILTQKNHWDIYKIKDFKSYGMEYRENLEGRRFPTPILYSEFIRELKETMLSNNSILEIKDIEVKLIRSQLYTKFTVKLKDFKEFSWEAYL